MKKNGWPVLALIPVCVLFMLSCGPSELENKEKLSDADLTLEGGRVAYYFNEPRIEKGKTYIVTFDMEACDESFLGNRMGGKLSYEDASAATMNIPAEGLLVSPTDASEEFYIVAGWDYCMPNIILDRPMKYKWTFTGGEQQRDNKPLFKDKNEKIIDWNKVPDDKAQFFLLIAQNLAWKNFGSFTQFGVHVGKGINELGISIREKVMPSGTLTMSSVITLDDRNNTTGAGVIRTDYSKLSAAFAADPYAFIRVYMKGCSFNATEIEERRSVAAIGNLDNIRSANPNAMVLVPAGGTTRPAGVAAEDFSDLIPARGGSGLNFYVDLDIEDILLFRKSDERNLNVTVSLGRLDRIELYTYQK
jgi:hypothetical protein